jgi:hypothetical protein
MPIPSCLVSRQCDQSPPHSVMSTTTPTHTRHVVDSEVETIQLRLSPYDHIVLPTNLKLGKVTTPTSAMIDSGTVTTL